MSEINLAKTIDKLTNIVEELDGMQKMACMADFLFAIVKSKHVCVSKAYFNRLKKLFVGKNDYKENEERHVYRLTYNIVIHSKFDLVVEYIKAEDVYLIKSIESGGITYTCDETVPRLVIS